MLLSIFKGTVRFGKFRTQKNYCFTLRSTQRGHKVATVLCPKCCVADGMAHSVDPDQTTPLWEKSDLGLRCLLRHRIIGYHKSPKFSDTQNFAVITLQF